MPGGSLTLNKFGRACSIRIETWIPRCLSSEDLLRRTTGDNFELGIAFAAAVIWSDSGQRSVEVAG
jgi:hypothetical protein